MRDPGHENTMYMLRSKSVKYISAYPLRNRVSAYPLQCTLRLFLGEGWSSPLRIRVSAYPLQTTLRLFLEEGWSLPLRIHVSAYPLHDQTTLRLFLGKWWSSPPRIHTIQGSTFEVAGYSAVTPRIQYATSLDLSISQIHHR